jgi:hypothetical protein
MMLRFLSWIFLSVFTLTGCGGGGSSASVNGTIYTMHEFTVSPDTISSADATSNLSIQIKQQKDGVISPYSGATVTFTSNCIAQNRASVSPVRVTNGSYTATYTNNGCTGNDVIIANANLGTTSLSPIEKTLSISSGASVSAIVSVDDLVVTAANTIVPADGQSRTLIKALVTDTAKKPIKNAQVTFTTNLGSMTAAEGETASTTSITTKTDSQGYARVYLISALTAGIARISASSGGIVRTTSVGFGSFTPPNRLLVTADPGTVNPEGESEIKAIVLDATGLPVSNVNVIFEVTENISGSSLISYSDTSDEKGIAKVKYKAGTGYTVYVDPKFGSIVTSSDAITATTANGVKKTAYIIVSNTNTTNNTLILTTGGTDVPANNAVKVLLLAKYQDKDNAPIANKTVTFTSDIGTLVDSNNTHLSSATTDKDGIARVYLRAGPVAQVTQATVSASVEGYVSTKKINFYPNP